MQRPLLNDSSSGAATPQQNNSSSFNSSSNSSTMDRIRRELQNPQLDDNSASQASNIAAFQDYPTDGGLCGSCVGGTYAPEANVITTGRYNLLTFFPQSLFEQFRRLANVYFLILGTIAAIGEYTGIYLTAVEAVGILTPMMTVVLISVIKDGIEDIKRHREDNKINKKLSHLISREGDVLPVEWSTLLPGNMILLTNGDEVPADVVVVSCGGIQGRTCYVETAAIDGETNLKPRFPCVVDMSNNLAESSKAEKAVARDPLGIFVTTTYSQPTSNRSSRSSFSAFLGSASPAVGSPANDGSGEPQTFRRVSGMGALRLSVCVEPPNEVIYGFNGAVNYLANAGILPSDSATSLANEKQHEVMTNSLTKDNLLLRGSTLRATEWAVCMVVYTGKNTKISLNAKKAPSKLSSVDRIVNKCLLIAIVSMLVVCLLSMCLSILWVDTNKEADYLCLTINSLADYGFIKPANQPSGQISGCISGSTESVLTVFTFATLYNNFVCISMYVSLEMVYLCQSFFISSDITLYDEQTNTPAECHSSGMCADLGQIQYVMSDKTGTLTKNEMKLKRISVAGIKYGAPVSLHSNQAGQGSNGQSRLPVASVSTSRQSINLLKEIRSSMSSASNTNTTSNAGIQPQRSSFQSTASSTTRRSQQLQNEGPIGSTGGLFDDAWEPLYLLGTPSTIAASGSAADSSSASHTHAINQGMATERNRIIQDFLRVCVCCNTCILMPDDHGQTTITDAISLKTHLQAESADEVALVLAAAEHSCTLLTKREGNLMYVRRTPLDSRQSESVLHNPPPTESLPAISTIDEIVEIMAVNEFDSDRKRMSVLAKLKMPTTSSAITSDKSSKTDAQYRYMLLVKGADSCVLPVCSIDTVTAQAASSSSGQASSSSYNWALDTVDHIEQFASTGLRTLVFAQKELSEQVALGWLNEHTIASKQVMRRQESLHAVAIAIEKDLQLLGAVGVEDELQDGVPEAIQTLLSAGLNVWMITGDKPETAVAISQQCGLLSDDHEVEKVLSLKGEALRQRILDLHGYLEGYAELSSVTGSSVAEGRDAYSFSITTPPDIHHQQLTNKRSIGAINAPIFSSAARADSGASDEDGTGGNMFSSNHSMQNMLQANMLGAHAQRSPQPFAVSAVSAATAAATLQQTKYISSISRVSGPYTTVEATSPIQKKIALIVDGASLEGIFQLPDLKKRFTEAVRCVPTVIACRVSPKQKALLVRMIKTGSSNPVTLAIGDGANDVGMIHEARVGVGIAGREGRHAANSSDFAIGQFKYLVPLLMEHGRFNYVRCSKLVLYSFFKNLVLVSVLFYFCLYSGYSGTVPLDSIVFSGYNFYLGLPIIALGALDYDIPRDSVYKYPALAYATGKNGEMLNLLTMFRWCSQAFFLGLIAFVVTIRMIAGDATYVEKDFQLHMNGPGGLMTTTGLPGGLFVFGYMIYTVLVVSMQYKVLVMTNTRTWINWTLWILSFIGYFFFTYVYGLFDSMDWFDVVPIAFQCAIFWLSLFVVPVVLIFADLCVEAILATYFPASVDILKRRLFEDELAMSTGIKSEISTVETFRGSSVNHLSANRLDEKLLGSSNFESSNGLLASSAATYIAPSIGQGSNSNPILRDSASDRKERVSVEAASLSEHESLNTGFG